MKVIECQNVNKTYGGDIALNDLSITIKPNTITGLIGRNGAGKTTLLKILAGFIRESSGEVRVFAEHPFNNLKVSTNMIFIDDQINPPTALSLKDLLAAGELFYPNFVKSLANGLFDYFSFKPKQTYQSLSKGMKSTFNMIMGLSARCPLTIFDEPTTGMDAAVRKDFYRALLKDYIDHPRTIILSSHLLNEMEEILEDVLLLKGGSPYLHLSISELKEYAVGVSGSKAVVSRWSEDKEILYKKEVGGSSYFVVENNLSEYERNLAIEEGLQLSAVSPDDLCVYLTSKHKGGIDDVFDRN